ncbi:peptide chain release factor N(5)-glutamine methyltransferase [Sungkyunkwania multivorans]|uniref:Release factor glutamine methyltransferase n=1 Tax=Sungkyunkwania multivorans TaxID=1173618 RepID=A0ABW3CXM5_9FLAO
MKLKDIKDIFHSELDAIFGKEEVCSFFFMLSEDYIGANRLTLALQPDFPVTKEEANQLFEALALLKRQKPIQQILGKTLFYGNEFMVDEHVLIPRPETEELVSWIVSDTDTQTPLKILDIGTGSGCIAISLAKALPKAEVHAMDVSEKAISLAKENALHNKIKVNFIEADVLQLASLEQEYDIIVSNPPYVRDMEKEHMKDNVLKYEPALALFVKDEDPLLFYRKIAVLAIENLREKGRLFFEINQYLGSETEKILKEQGFDKIELRQDSFGVDRMMKATK